MSHRSLAIVAGLTLGDYLLWNWSLGGRHDVIAIISGLSLLPLLLATAWLLAVTVARVLARSTRPTARREQRAMLPARAVAPSVAPLRGAAMHGGTESQSAQASAPAGSTGKLAA